MLTGGADPVETSGAPPEGFIRLAPVAPQGSATRRGGVRPGAGVVLSFLVAVGTALASLQTLIPWAAWRSLMQGVGVLVMFGGLGIWVKLTQREMAARQAGACEHPPVWIRVSPSVAPDHQALGETLVEAGKPRPDRRAPLVEATGATRS